MDIVFMSFLGLSFRWLSAKLLLIYSTILGGSFVEYLIFFTEEPGMVSWWPRQIDILQCRVWDFETILCGGQMTTQISFFWLTMNPFGFFPHVTGLSLLSIISIRDRNFLFWGILVEFCLCLLDWLPASQFSAVLVCSTLPQTLL